MKSLSILFVLLFIPIHLYCQDIVALEEKAKSTVVWQEKVDIYLSIIDTLVWLGDDYDKGKFYVEKISEICENKDCAERELLAKIQLAELEINSGNEQTIHDLILPTLSKDNSNLSNKTQALLHELAGYYHLVNGNGQQAITYYSTAKNILEKKHINDKRLGKIYYNLGFSYNINGINDKSIEFLEKSIQHFTQSNDLPMLINAQSGLSTLLATDGKYNEAIKQLLVAINTTEKEQLLKKFQFELQSSLMDIYIRNKNYNKAEKVYKNIMPKLYETNIPIQEKAIDIWSFHMSYAKLLGKKYQTSRALQYVDSSYIYAGYLSDFTVRITDLRKAGLLVKNKNYELAESQMIKLIEDLKPFGNVDAFHAVMLGLFSKIYSNSSFKPSEKIIEELTPIVDRVLSKNENQYNSDRLDAEHLSVILGIYVGDRKRALKSLAMVTAIKDTLQSIESTRSINELMIQYDTKEKEKIHQIQTLELSKKTSEQKTLIVFFIATLLILATLYLFFIQKKNYAKHLEEEVNKRTAELKQTNQELSQNKEELERYNYIASHDLKEPLRNVVSFVDFIKRKKLIKEDDTLIYFDYIEKGAMQMNKIVQDLTDLSKLQNHGVKLQSIQVAGIIKQIKDNLEEGLLTATTTILTQNLPESIICDETIFSLVFKGLIENGLKFNEHDIPTIIIEYHQAEEKHIFKIRDNGIGIPDEYHDQIFELFKRLNDRSKYGGSGVGLAICKKLLHKIKGNISLSANQYKGTTFVVEIPVELNL